MEYKGKYGNELKSFFDKVHKTLYPDGTFKWGVDSRIGNVVDLVNELTYDQVLEMFPDLWDIDYENWSEYSICLEDNNEEVLNIGLYRESKDDEESTHSIEYFIGGDIKKGVGGEMIDCISFSLSKEKRTKD